MHTCPHPDCEIPVEDEMFACRKHWFSLPQDIRSPIWTAYRRHGVGSEELAAAHRRARDFWSPAEAERERAEGRA